MGMRRIGDVTARAGLLAVPMVMALQAFGATPSPQWEWSGLLVLNQGESLPRGAAVHVAMIDGDCDGLELAHYDEVLATPRRSVAFRMLAPAAGHDGHLVMLTAEITGPDQMRLEPSAHFELVSHRWKGLAR
jgi:hypothetical protein